MPLSKIACTFLISLFVVACGGGSSGSGSGSSSNFSKDIADAAIASSGSILARQSGNVPLRSSEQQFSSSNDVNSLLVDVTKNRLSSIVDSIIAEELSGQKTADRTEVDTTSVAGSCGGTLESISTITSPDAVGVTYPITGMVRSTFNNYCIGSTQASVTINGTATVDFTLSSVILSSHSYSFNISYSAVTPQGNTSGSWNATESCTTTSGNSVCTASSSEVVNGTTYTLSNAVVSGNNSSGYQYSGTMSNGTDTYVVNAANITVCGNNKIGTGTITLTINLTDTVIVSFPNCNQMVVTYQGVSTTYSQ